ncbi:MAG: hypothetical protein GY822_15500, partial [Deltaproteobacteria bacterium]|nr:hypothetical protein [Deltaproteobacteria bacterium]
MNAEWLAARPHLLPVFERMQSVLELLASQDLSYNRAMGIARHLQLRWIWLSVYLIAGCLSSAYIVFALLDSLPS